MMTKKRLAALEAKAHPKNGCTVFLKTGEEVAASIDEAFDAAKRGEVAEIHFPMSEAQRTARKNVILLEIKRRMESEAI